MSLNTRLRFVSELPQLANNGHRHPPGSSPIVVCLKTRAECTLVVRPPPTNTDALHYLLCTVTRSFTSRNDIPTMPVRNNRAHTRSQTTTSDAASPSDYEDFLESEDDSGEELNDGGERQGAACRSMRTDETTDSAKGKSKEVEQVRFVYNACSVNLFCYSGRGKPGWSCFAIVPIPSGKLHRLVRSSR